MTEQKPIILPTGRAFRDVLTRLISNGAFVLIILVFVGVYIFRKEVHSPRSLIMLFGAITSLVCLLGYLVIIENKAQAQPSKRSFVLSLVAIGGLVPYAFGCYLVTYEGIWGFWRLHNGFSIWSMLASVFYIIAGYQVVQAIYRLSELGQSISDGRAIFEKAT